MIAFSGIDCSGKSTQIEIVVKYLEKVGKKPRVIWSRGGYTPWIEAFKTMIRPDKNYSKEEKEAYRASISASGRKSKLLLWASICDLIRYYGIVFRLIELRGTTIVCDRYIWDTYIDFKIKYPGIDFENWAVWKLLMLTYKKPKQSFIFTIPAEESVRRSALKDDPHPEPIETRIKRIELYLELINDNKWGYVIDARNCIQEVSKQIMIVLEGHNYEN